MMKNKNSISVEWKSVDQLNRRSLGLEQNHHFREQANSAISRVKCLTQTDSLEFHEGCVNAVNFNSTGDLIASASDDLRVAVWDWMHSHKPKVTYDSGHSLNVFQAKFMPHTSDSTIVTSARDGQIRVGVLTSIGKLQHTNLVAQHKGPAHKLSVEPGSPYLFKTAGEDAVVFDIDLRESKAKKLFTLHNSYNRRVALYSIHTNPVKTEEFTVGGRDQWARIFDTRMITQEKENNCIKKFCPDHIRVSNEMTPNITCLMYNYDGSELLVSYNDEDIYLFDTSHSAESNSIHCYKGHRNSDTVKSVNFFGAHSEYVVSGSDCSHIFIWKKSSEEVVTFLKGDEVGVVNVLENHPHACILATAGLDHDVKLWQPVGKCFSEIDELHKQMKINKETREEDRKQGPSSFDNQLIFLLMRGLQRQQRIVARQRRRENRENGDTDELSSSDDESGNSEFEVSSSDLNMSNPDDEDVDDDGNEEDEESSTNSSKCVQS